MQITTRNILLFSTGTIICLGLVMLASASLSISENITGNALYFFNRQLIFLCVGLIVALIVYQLPINFWNQHSVLFLSIAFLLLTLVLVPYVGKSVKGSMRWIPLGPINFQPSELAKIFLVIYLASYLARRREEVRNEWLGLLKPLGVLALAMLLLLAEPDFGSVVVIMMTAFSMIFLCGVKLKKFLSILGIGVLMLGVLAIAKPYRMQRLIDFRDPFENPFGSGYQLTQSLIAFGRGEWTGIGLGNSIQKLFYLPEAHTDFLFAVLAEELGLVGNLLVIALYTAIVISALCIGRASAVKENFFSAYFAYGLGILIGIQAVFNLGVNMGILPTKGLTLPFMSYGGSSLIINCMGLGALLKIDEETRAESLERVKRKLSNSLKTYGQAKYEAELKFKKQKRVKKAA
ncbi:MAG TPA: putative lipid II flippase FtsW [Pseudomonadales bacterium]